MSHVFQSCIIHPPDQFCFKTSCKNDHEMKFESWFSLNNFLTPALVESKFHLSGLSGLTPNSEKSQLPVGDHFNTTTTKPSDSKVCWNYGRCSVPSSSVRQVNNCSKLFDYIWQKYFKTCNWVVLACAASVMYLVFLQIREKEV